MIALITTLQNSSAAANSSDPAGTLGIGIVIVGMYFAPTIVGWKKRNASAIAMLNFFLGWTVIGWIVAMVWAVSVAPDEIERDEPQTIAQVSTLCQSCGKYSAGLPKFCASCGAQIA